MITIPMTGISGIYSIEAEVYHADPCPQPSLSASIAHILCTRSPLHAFTAHPKLGGFVTEAQEHFEIGTAAHALLLEGDSSAVVVLDYPDWRTKVAREARDSARTDGQVPILRKNWDAVQAMVAAASPVRTSLADGLSEQTVMWQEEDIWCRARFDWLSTDRKKIIDYKTTSASANPEVVSRTLFGNGWDVQACFYLRGLKAITGITADFHFIVQETFPPYALSTIALGPDSMTIAEKKVQWAIETWANCLRENNWPSYPEQICYALLPAWEEARWLEKELNEL